MRCNDALSRQSSCNTKDSNNTEVKGIDISIHVLEADITFSLTLEKAMVGDLGKSLWLGENN